MRMRLTPDVQKMVISTLHGYLVVIHDLDLANMKKDLEGELFIGPRPFQKISVRGGGRDICGVRAIT